MAENQVTPEVLWAQRSSTTDQSKNFVYVTISVPDCPVENLQLDLKPQGLTFTGKSDTLKRTYHIELEFYDEIVPEESKTHHTGKNIEMRLQKKEQKEEYWPRLLKDTKKMHFLRTDFDKWVDEDEQIEAAANDMDFGDMGGMGGMPGMGGMGGMPGMGGGNDFGGIDFSKLSGAGASEDAGADSDEEELSEDDMPDLEGDDEEGAKKSSATGESGEAPAAESKEESKIAEVVEESKAADTKEEPKTDEPKEDAKEETKEEVKA